MGGRYCFQILPGTDCEGPLPNPEHMFVGPSYGMIIISLPVPLLECPSNQELESLEYLPWRANAIAGFLGLLLSKVNPYKSVTIW